MYTAEAVQKSIERVDVSRRGHAYTVQANLGQEASNWLKSTEPMSTMRVQLADIWCPIDGRVFRLCLSKFSPSHFGTMFFDFSLLTPYSRTFFERFTQKIFLSNALCSPTTSPVIENEYIANNCLTLVFDTGFVPGHSATHSSKTVVLLRLNVKQRRVRRRTKKEVAR